MLGESREPIADEWAVHDYDSLPNLGEYPSIDQIATIAQGIEEHGEAFAAYVEWLGPDGASIEDFNDKYLGELDTRAELAEDWLDNIAGLAEVPEHLQAYFDFDAYGRDMLLDGCVVNEGGHWFYNT